MAVLDFPLTVKINQAEWSIISRTQTFTSELTNVTQTVSLPGDRWASVLTFSNKMGLEARALISFLVQLRGRAGRFRIKPPVKFKRDGFATFGGTVTSINTDGSVVISGTTSFDPTGDTTYISGDNHYMSIDGIVLRFMFAVGDYVGINGELKMVTADSYVNDAGNCVLYFAPFLRNTTLGTTIEVNNPTCTMMLQDDNQVRWGVQPLPIYALTIAAVEAIEI